MNKFKCILGLHYQDPVPTLTTNVFSFYYCRHCGKVLVLNRNTGYKYWTSYKNAIDKYHELKRG